MSIHELEFVPAVADKVLAVADNKVFKVGKPEEIFTGENIENIYHMEAGTGKVIVDGILSYSKALARTIIPKE